MGIEKKRKSSVEIMVLVAYSYFLLISMAFFIARLYITGEFSILPVFLVLVFAIQAWFSNKLANLIIGILTLIGSIFGTLEFLSLGLRTGFNTFSGTMELMSVAGVILSGILIFSYTHLSFRDR